MILQRQWTPLVRSLLRRSGFDIVRYLPKRRMRIIEDAAATVVLDIGANTGQYASALRGEGFAGRIVSVEPLADEFARLCERAGDDPRWQCRQLALGDADADGIINVAADPPCSSLLGLRAWHARANPNWAFVGRERVVVRRLDTVAPEFLSCGDRPYLKLDVQGFELAVLKGGEATLPWVHAVEAELSLDYIYNGQPLLPEVAAYLYDRGFRLVWMERIFNDPVTDHLLQVDAIFMRRQPALSPRPQLQRCSP
jgi:FkbM family methyltransferase